MGGIPNEFIPFYPMENVPQINWQTLNILGNKISQSFMSSLKCDHPFF